MKISETYGCRIEIKHKDLVDMLNKAMQDQPTECVRSPEIPYPCTIEYYSDDWNPSTTGEWAPDSKLVIKWEEDAN